MKTDCCNHETTCKFWDIIFHPLVLKIHGTAWSKLIYQGRSEPCNETSPGLSRAKTVTTVATAVIIAEEHRGTLTTGIWRVIISPSVCVL